MAVIMFLALTVVAIYAGIFVGALAFRSADHLFKPRDPEAIKRWNLDRQYVRLMMGRRTV